MKHIPNQRHYFKMFGPRTVV